MVWEGQVEIALALWPERKFTLKDAAAPDLDLHGIRIF